MKTFERLVLQYLKTCIPPSFDPFQFAYRANRSVEDAISIEDGGADALGLGCPLEACATELYLDCHHGLQQDHDGCDICACHPAPERSCSSVMCSVLCNYMPHRLYLCPTCPCQRNRLPGHNSLSLSLSPLQTGASPRESSLQTGASPRESPLQTGASPWESPLQTLASPGSHPSRPKPAPENRLSRPEPAPRSHPSRLEPAPGSHPPDRSQPQRIASPDRSQPQRIASPDQSQPQGVTPPDRSQPQGVTSLDRSQLQGITPPQQIHPQRITLPGRVQSPRTACPDRSQTHGGARPKRLQPKRATRSDWSQSTGITPLDKNGPLKKTHPDRNQSRQIVPSVWWQSQGTSPKLCQFLSQLPEIAQPHSGNSKQRTPSDHGQCHRNTSGDQRQPRRKAPANQGCCKENLTSFHGRRQQSTSPCSLPSACMRSKNCTFLITDPSTQRTQTTRSQMHTPLAADCAVELVGQDSAPGYNMQCDSDDSIKQSVDGTRLRVCPGNRTYSQNYGATFLPVPRVLPPAYDDAENRTKRCCTEDGHRKWPPPHSAVNSMCNRQALV
ncbi:hypothetical protein ACOMHN_037576 [Nucella lapillus]